MSPKSHSLAPKRGLTSGIDPGIHFQRPWGDSEAWQGSVTIPPPPASWGADGEGTPPPHSGQALEARTTLASSSFPFQPNRARCCSIHRGKPSGIHPPSRAGIYPGAATSGQTWKMGKNAEQGQTCGKIAGMGCCHCVPRPCAGVCAAPQWEQLPRSR